MVTFTGEAMVSEEGGCLGSEKAETMTPSARVNAGQSAGPDKGEHAWGEGGTSFDIEDFGFKFSGRMGM